MIVPRLAFHVEENLIFLLRNFRGKGSQFSLPDMIKQKEESKAMVDNRDKQWLRWTTEIGNSQLPRELAGGCLQWLNKKLSSIKLIHHPYDSLILSPCLVSLYA